MIVAKQLGGMKKKKRKRVWRETQRMWFIDFFQPYINQNVEQ